MNKYNVGDFVKKISGKPFKSGLRIDEVKETNMNHPTTGRPAIILKTDSTIVEECRLCLADAA